MSSLKRLVAARTFDLVRVSTHAAPAGLTLYIRDPAAGPGRRGGRRGTRGITNGISRERSSPDGCTMYAFGLRRAAIPGTGDRGVREPSPVRTERRAGRGHAPDRADSGRLREAASRACGDGVTPHCTYGGTARRARRDLLCAPCGLFDIPTASVVPPHGSTHAMTLRTARGARARRPHARETDRRDGCGAFRRSP